LVGAPQPQQPKRLKGLRIATRCGTLDEFIATFERLCDVESVFISTNGSRPVGLETAFSIELTDGTPALRGLGVVRQSWTTSDNPFGRPGVKIGIHRLTSDSVKVFERMLDAKVRAEAERAAAPVQFADGANTDIAVPPFMPPPPLDEARTPGSELVLPANPLSGIADKSLEGFVDCTLFEETGNFFPTDPAELQGDSPGELSGAAPELAPIARREKTATPLPFQIEAAQERAVDPTQAGPAVLPLRVPAATPVPAVTPLVQLAPSLPWSGSMQPPARGSERAIELSGADILPATPPAQHPSVAVPESGLPPVAAPERPAQPRWRVLLAEHRRWAIASGAAVLALVVIVIIVAASRSSTGAASTSRSEPASAPAAPSVAQAAATPEAAHGDEAPASENGMPVVGKGPCRMTVTSTPAGAAVQVDGEAIGPSPIVVAGPCKVRQVVVSHPRYAQAVRSVTLTEAKAETVDLTLPRPMHHVLVDTQPSGAIISIAGHRAGVSPTNVDVLGFTAIDVTITKAGYQPVTKRVYSRVPSDRLSVKLTK
jgi:hypothetical protein